MSRIRRIGLRPDPPGGWPLDHVLVGVATLRTLRELYYQPYPLRPWDLALRSGVTPQGTANALLRLEGLGLASRYLPLEPWQAHRFGLAKTHFLRGSLIGLFAAEHDEVKRLAREARLAARGFSAPAPDRQ